MSKGDKRKKGLRPYKTHILLQEVRTEHPNWSHAEVMIEVKHRIRLVDEGRKMNPKLNEELKPCPFCGEKPKVKEWLDAYGEQAIPASIKYQIACPFKTTCPVQPMTEWREKKQDCVKEWNTRKVKNG